MKFIDSHCHLDYLKKQTCEETLAKSLEANVDKIITVSVDPSNQNTALALAKQFENVFCTQGVHPHEAKLWDEEVKQKIVKNIKEKEVVGIGEIGLDYHYDQSPRDIQRQSFEEQLQIVAQNELPVVLHSREAEEDTIAILKNFLPQIKKSGVFHCFTSNQKLAEFALDNGFYLGFNGIITFKAAENVRDILKTTPPERILIETDAPFLAPIPYRGKENGPFYIPYVAEKIAEVKKMDLEELTSIVYQNSVTLFQL